MNKPRDLTKKCVTKGGLLTVTICIPEWQGRLVDTICDANAESRSGFVRRTLRAYLDMVYPELIREFEIEVIKKTHILPIRKSDESDYEYQERCQACLAQQK